MTDEPSTTDNSADADSSRKSASAPSGDLLADLDVTPQSLVRSIIVGAMSYGFAWIAGLMSTALVLALLHIEEAGDEASWWWLLSAPGQLVAMAFRSPAAMSVSSGDDEFAFSGSVSTTASPLTILAIALVALFVLSRRDESANPSKSVKGALAASFTTALTFVIMSWLLALVLKLEVDDADGVSSFGAGQIQIFVFGLSAITLTALLARRPWEAWERLAAVPEAARGAWRAVLTHLVVFSVITVPAAIVWIIVEGGSSALLALPALLVNLLVYALTIGHFGALTIGGAGSFLGEFESGSESVWAFTEGSDKILLLLILFAAIALLAAATVLHVRGNGEARSNAHWVAAGAVYAGVGGALTFLATASTGIGSSFGADGNASFGPAPWFFLVFALWGLLAELLARLIGPALQSVLPTVWIDKAAGERNTVRTSGLEMAETRPSGATDSPSMDPRSRKVLLGIAALVATVVAAVIGVSVANGMFFGPEASAKAYFTALHDGDADAALDLARVELTSEERVLLTDKVLGASSEKIEDVDVGNVDKDGDLAEVTVAFTIDGAEHTQDVTMRKAGSRFGVFDDWELVDPGLGSIYITAPNASGLEVNGQRIRLTEPLEDGVSLPAFPGSYEITPITGSDYLTFTSQDATIVDEEESLDFEVSASPDLDDEVTRLADEFLKGCIAKEEAEPEGCPNITYGGFDLQDVKWTLDTSPTYSVSADAYEGLTFTTDTVGSATVTATEPSFFDGDPATKFKDTVDIEFSGTIGVDGDSVTIEVEDYFF